jgi:hypothetical protein
MPSLTTDSEGQGLAALLAKEEIRECLLRFARGCDRVDENLLLSAFHDDAVDLHGPSTAPREFLKWWLPEQERREVRQGFLTNISIDLDLDGDAAHVESYYLCVIGFRDQSQAMVQGGRYVDRFERRDGVGWRIATRVLIPEFVLEADAHATAALIASSPGRRSGDDPSYERPLVRTVG